MNPSPPPPPGDPREQAALHAAGRQARVRRIRNRTAAGSAAAFVAVFGGLYGQLSAGNDPALASTAPSTQTSGSGDTANQSASGSTTEKSANDGSSTWSSDSAEPATTGQS